jgi:hypothetical protein
MVRAATWTVGLLAPGDGGPGQGHRDQIAGGCDQERDVQVQGLAGGGSGRKDGGGGLAWGYG